jgi:ankyrin repeat protein
LEFGYSREDQLADAVFLEDVDEVRALLDEGVGTDAVDEDHRTPLMAAVAVGHVVLVQLLLAAGADPNARDADGWTPLHVAAQRRRLDLAWLLVRAGADVNARDDDGNSVLWRALLTCTGQMDIIDFLRRAGARDDVRNTAGFSARDVAGLISVHLDPVAVSVFS